MIAACADSHQFEIPAGCEVTRAALDCPRFAVIGAPITVEVRHSAPGCGAGDFETELIRTGEREFAISSFVCGAEPAPGSTCFEAREEVSLTGIEELGIYVITAGDASCEIDIGRASIPSPTLPSEVLSLECPASVYEDEVITLGVFHSDGQCCDEAEARVSVREAGDITMLDPQIVEASGCHSGRSCEAYLNLVEIAPRPPGSYEFRGARGSDVSCVVDVLPLSPMECEVLEPDQVFAPHVVLFPQPVETTLLSYESVGCGCLPTSTPDREIAICDLEECISEPCVDPGYGVHLREAAPIGTFRRTGQRDIEVVETLEGCRPIEVTMANVVEPPAVNSDGPLPRWLAVTVLDHITCPDPRPLPAMRQVDGGLEAVSCTANLDICFPAPFEVTTYYPLGTGHGVLEVNGTPIEF